MTSLTNPKQGLVAAWSECHFNEHARWYQDIFYPQQEQAPEQFLIQHKLQFGEMVLVSIILGHITS